MKKSKKIILITGIVLLLAVIAVIANHILMKISEKEVPSFKVELVIDTEGVYKVFYSGYIDGVRSCSGAQADLDGKELELGRVLDYELTSYLFDEDADLSKFSIDFSPFDNEGQYELGRTNEVTFPAEYGQTYRIHLTHDDNGYHAIPEWEDEEAREKFTVEIGGDVLPDNVDWSYIQADYFLGGEQYGYMYSCVNEGNDAILLDFFKEDLERYSDEPGFTPDLSDVRIELYLSYSDYKGDEAVEQAMHGNTGENEYLTSVSFSAEYGQTYQYRLTRDRDSGYKLKTVS